MQMFLHPLGRLDLYCKGLFVWQRSFSVDEAETYTVGTVPIVYLNICDCHKVSSDPGDTKENNNK